MFRPSTSASAFNTMSSRFMIINIPNRIGAFVPIASSRWSAGAQQLRPISSLFDKVRHARNKFAPCNFTCKKEILTLYESLGDYPDYKVLDDDVCLDPHNEDKKKRYYCLHFRAKDGSRLNREIATNDFILVRDDVGYSGGMSAVLNIPIPPGGTLSVQMSTWQTAMDTCDHDYQITKGKTFGVGMVPYGTAKKTCWKAYSKARLHTNIKDGVQYYSGCNRKKHDYNVMRGGSSILSSENKEMALDVIDIRIRRDIAGSSELSFAHANGVVKVVRTSFQGEDNPADMQLFFNCHGWAGNMSYLQIHKVVYDPPSMLFFKKWIK